MAAIQGTNSVSSKKTQTWTLKTKDGIQKIEVDEVPQVDVTELAPVKITTDGVVGSGSELLTPSVVRAQQKQIARKAKKAAAKAAKAAAKVDAAKAAVEASVTVIDERSSITSSMEQFETIEYQPDPVDVSESSPQAERVKLLQSQLKKLQTELEFLQTGEVCRYECQCGAWISIFTDRGSRVNKIIPDNPTQDVKKSTSPVMADHDVNDVEEEGPIPVASPTPRKGVWASGKKFVKPVESVEPVAQVKPVKLGPIKLKPGDLSGDPDIDLGRSRQKDYPLDKETYEKMMKARLGKKYRSPEERYEFRMMLASLSPEERRKLWEDKKREEYGEDYQSPEQRKAEAKQRSQGRRDFLTPEEREAREDELYEMYGDEYIPLEERLAYKAQQRQSGKTSRSDKTSQAARKFREEFY